MGSPLLKGPLTYLSYVDRKLASWVELSQEAPALCPGLAVSCFDFSHCPEVPCCLSCQHEPHPTWQFSCPQAVWGLSHPYQVKPSGFAQGPRPGVSHAFYPDGALFPGPAHGVTLQSTESPVLFGAWALIRQSVWKTFLALLSAQGFQFELKTSCSHTSVSASKSLLRELC